MNNLRRRTLLNTSGGIDPTTGRGFVDGYEVVDLGLKNGLLFATCNVGATEETGYGDYYMYGKGSRKYNSSDSIYEGTEVPLASNADTATQVMGEGWRMPTKEELQDLVGKTNFEWINNFNESGINGAKFTSKTNPSAYVFFPAAVRINDSISNFISFTWSSTPNEKDYAFLLLCQTSVKYITSSNRRDGVSVRGVHAAI